MKQQQQDAIDYLQEENRVLREQLGNKRRRMKDARSRRLAVKAKKLGRRPLHEMTIATPEKLLAWHERLIARKYDGSKQRAPGRPRTGDEVARSTAANILKDHGIEPAPERNRKAT